MTLPPFTAEGLLPPGDYELTLAELQASHLVTGEGNPSPTWDAGWRGDLVRNAGFLISQLWRVGITQTFLDGSFVENKDHPNDIDGYFECDILYFARRELHRDLNALDPYKVWTWNWQDRRPDPNSTKPQLPMWHQYRVELYPHYQGGTSGIPDAAGNDQPFPAAFRRRRGDHRPKGIVKIIP